jgi:uncharacterized membrane protein
MNEKGFFQSKTTWSAILLLLAPVFAHFGWTLDTIVMENTIMEFIGIIGVVYGQFTRKSEIKGAWVSK